jgi:hypothetical protein
MHVNYIENRARRHFLEIWEVSLLELFFLLLVVTSFALKFSQNSISYSYISTSSAFQNACNFNRMSVSRFETFMYTSFRFYNRHYVSISRVSSISVQNIHLLLIDLKQLSKEDPIKCLRSLTSLYLNDILNPRTRLLLQSWYFILKWLLSFYREAKYCC